MKPLYLVASNGQGTQYAGGGGGGGDDMDARLRQVEQHLAVIESNYATKADLHQEISGQTWKIIGFMVILSGGLLAAVARGFGWF